MLGVGVPLGTPGKVIFVFTAGTETLQNACWVPYVKYVSATDPFLRSLLCACSWKLAPT